MTAALDLLHRRDWTPDELLALPDDGYRYEIIDGGLAVSPPPSPRHQGVLARLARLLDERLPVGEHQIQGVGLAVHGRRPTEFVIPDLLVYVGELPERHFTPEQVRLVVEVVSPSSRRMDRATKRDLYEELGVPEYWVIDPSVGRLDVHGAPRLSGLVGIDWEQIKV